MNTVVFQKLDKDLSTVLLDLNSLQVTPSSGIGVLDPVDLGVPEGTDEFIHEAPFPESYQVTPDRGVATATFRLRIKGATRDARLLQLQVLGRELNRPGTYKIQWEATAEPIYFDAFSAVIQPEMHGQEYSQTMAVTKADDIITVTLKRLPYLYGPRIDSSVNLLRNSMFMKDSDGDNTPDTWTLVNGTLTPEPEDLALRVSDNAANDKFYQETTLFAGAEVTGSIQGYRESGDRTVQLILVSRPSGATLDTVTIPAGTIDNARVEVSGTIAPGDTIARLKVTYSGGSTATVAHVRFPQLESGLGPSTAYRAGSEIIGIDPSTGGRIYSAFIHGSAPTRGRFIIMPDAGANLVQLTMGKRVVGSLHGFIRSHWKGADDMTLGTDASLQSDASATEGDKVRVTFATMTRMAPRVSFTMQDTEDDALRGNFIVMGRIKIDGGTARYRLRLHWSPGDTVKPAFTCPPVVLESATANITWMAVELGRVTLDEKSDKLQMVIEMGRPGAPTTGSGLLELNHVYLVPTGPVGTVHSDEHTILSARGWRDNFGSDLQRWKGSEMEHPSWGAGGGTQDGDDVDLRLNNHVRVIPPASTGFQLEDGRYVITAVVVLSHNPGDNGGRGARHVIARLQLVSATTGGVLEQKDLWLNDGVASARKRISITFTIQGSGSQFNYAVRMLNNAELSNARCKIVWIIERVQRTLNFDDIMVFSGEYGYAEGPTGAYLVGSAGDFQEPLYQEGPFFELPPGPVLFTLDPGEIMSPNSEDVDRRGPTPLLTLGRAVDVQLQYFPRSFA